MLGSSARFARAIAYGIVLRQIDYGTWVTASILRQIYYRRNSMADVFQQIYYGIYIYITADILRQIYYG